MIPSCPSSWHGETRDEHVDSVLLRQVGSIAAPSLGQDVGSELHPVLLPNLGREGCRLLERDAKRCVDRVGEVKLVPPTPAELSERISRLSDRCPTAQGRTATRRTHAGRTVRTSPSRAPKRIVRMTRSPVDQVTTTLILCYHLAELTRRRRPSQQNGMDELFSASIPS